MESTDNITYCTAITNSFIASYHAALAPAILKTEHATILATDDKALAAANYATFSASFISPERVSNPATVTTSIHTPIRTTDVTTQ